MDTQKRKFDYVKIIGNVIISLVIIIIYLLLGDSAASRNMLVGGFSGLIAMYSTSSPTTLFFRGKSNKHAQLVDLLERLKYIRSSREKFVLNLPRYLRYDSQNVSIINSDENLIVICPRYLKRKINNLVNNK